MVKINGYLASLSADVSNSDSSTTTHTNSTLNAKNINLSSTKDTNIVGVNIHATELTNLDVGGDLNVASVQDRTKSSSHSLGASAGVSGTLGAGVTGVNAGVNGSNSRTNTKETVLTSITGGSVNVNVKGNTDLKGAMISGGDMDEEGNYHTLV